MASTNHIEWTSGSYVRPSKFQTYFIWTHRCHNSCFLVQSIHSPEYAPQRNIIIVNRLDINCINAKIPVDCIKLSRWSDTAIVLRHEQYKSISCSDESERWFAYGSSISQFHWLWFQYSCHQNVIDDHQSTRKLRVKTFYKKKYQCESIMYECVCLCMF